MIDLIRALFEIRLRALKRERQGLKPAFVGTPYGTAGSRALIRTAYQTTSRQSKLLLSALLLAATGGLLSCSSAPPPATKTPEVVRQVPVLTVQRAPVPDLLEAVGTVHASQSANLAAQIMGTIVSVNVHEGDRVSRGQVLAVIDDTQARSGLDRATAAGNAADHEAAAAETDFNLASTTLKRYQDLFEKKSISPQEFDEIKARFQAASARRDLAHAGQAQAKAGLEQARTLLDYTRIRAPFDGVVTERRIDPGALASPGMPLLAVEAAGRFRLEATVDEVNLRLLREGEIVPVQIEAIGDTRLQGKVVQIVPAADPASRSFIVKIELASQAGIRSGLFGRAYFTRGQRESVTVPRSAVMERGQLQAVYVLGPGAIANLRYVTLGKAQDDNLEVLSGLQPGDRLVAAPAGRELDGKRIEVQ